MSTVLETQTQPALALPALARSAWYEPLLQIVRNMFGMDYRSLGLMRIGMGALLVWVAYINAAEMRIFYTDEGVLPRTVYFNSAVDPPGFSLYFANGGMPYVATLFVLQGILAFMMMIGYRTRLATIGSYIFLLSMQNRHPVLLYGADIVLRVCLFWAMFLPWGRRFSMDRLTGRVPAPANPTYLSLATIAFFVQFASVYAGGAMMKTGATWRVEHNAVAYALALDVYSRPIGHWLGQFPKITTALTWGTLYLELYGPLLFVMPVLSRWFRLFGIFFFAGLQIGFGVCMYLGYFGPVMITITLCFLPAVFWDRWAGPLGRRVAAIAGPWFSEGGIGAPPGSLVRRWVHWQRARNATRTPFVRGTLRRVLLLSFSGVRELTAATLAVVVVMWNIGNVRVASGGPWPFGRDFTSLMFTIGINQTWDMFSPNPQTIDGWFVVVGTMRDGTTVNLMNGESPAGYDKPADVANSYGCRLWMSYLISFWYEGSSDPEAFARYLGEHWNARHPRDEQFETVEIDMMLERVEHSAQGPWKSGDVEQKLVWVEWFW
jgi:hypothetical protein